jgi:hypothetical protein
MGHGAGSFICDFCTCEGGPNAFAATAQQDFVWLRQIEQKVRKRLLRALSIGTV